MIHFGDIPQEYSGLENAKTVILPIPYDGTSTWVKGADKGPEAFLEASANMELYDIETDSEPFETGIYTAPPVLECETPDAMVEGSYQAARKYLDMNKFLLSIGGEHSVSNGPIKACFEKYPGMSVLQLDAHTDLRNSYEGSAFNHACVMARAQEFCPVVQVGIRSMDVGEKERLVPGMVFWAHQLHESNDWMQDVIDKLTDEVYLTIDLDVFDPSVMPSTGTPEPGGLYWYQVLDLIRLLARQRRIVAADIVELCPDPNEKSSDFLAAKLAYKILAYKYFLK